MLSTLTIPEHLYDEISLSGHAVAWLIQDATAELQAKYDALKTSFDTLMKAHQHTVAENVTLRQELAAPEPVKPAAPIPVFDDDLPDTEKVIPPVIAKADPLTSTGEYAVSKPGRDPEPIPAPPELQDVERG